MNCEWPTPQGLYKGLDYVFSFTLDPCPIGGSKDGLEIDWTGHRVFLNPPYDRRQLPLFCKKAIDSDASVIVALLPAKTDTKWFHGMQNSKKFLFIFLSGRLSYGDRPGRAPFGSMLAISL